MVEMKVLFKPGTRVVVETQLNVWIGTVVLHTEEFITLVDVLNSELKPMRDKRVPRSRITSLCKCPVLTVDGAGSGICDVCRGELEFSWRVRYSDGSCSTRCSNCLP